MPEDNARLLDDFMRLQTKFMMVQYLNGMTAAHEAGDEAKIARYAGLLAEALSFALKCGLLNEDDLAAVSQKMAGGAN